MLLHPKGLLFCFALITLALGNLSHSGNRIKIQNPGGMDQDTTPQDECSIEEVQFLDQSKDFSRATFRPVAFVPKRGTHTLSENPESVGPGLVSKVTAKFFKEATATKIQLDVWGQTKSGEGFHKEIKYDVTSEPFTVNWEIMRQGKNWITTFVFKCNAPLQLEENDSPTKARKKWQVIPSGDQ